MSERAKMTSTGKQRRRQRQRGVALIAVLVAIAIILVMTNQFGSTTNVDLFAAANHRDQMRAHFLARSAANLSELVIRLQQRIDNTKDLRGQVQITDFADQVILAFCGGAEEVKSAVGFSPDKVKGLGANIGTCGIVNQQITTEDDKLNVNCLNGTDATAATFKSAPLLSVSRPLACAVWMAWPDNARASPFGVPWSNRTSIGGDCLGAQALSHELEHGGDLLTRDVELLDNLVDAEILEILDDSCYGQASALEHPGPADLARDALDDRALGPVKGCHEPTS